MSIILKGIDKPSDCYYCDFEDHGYCRALGSYIDVEEGIDTRCPIEEIVRCAECIHKRLYDGETKYYYCALEDRPNRNWSVDDWNFCFWGERKESE